MTDTFPDIVPVGFQGDYTDFNHVKCQRSGDVRRTAGDVSIPAATATGKIIGLFPFNSGMSFVGLSGYNFYVADLDTCSTVTMSLGVQYQNTGQGTTNLTLIESASTVAQSAGYIPPTGTSWQEYVTTGNGWVVASITLGPTTTTGSITYNVPFVYDQPLLVA